MTRWKRRCEVTMFTPSWVLVLAVLFVITKQTLDVAASWWWLLAIITLSMFLTAWWFWSRSQRAAGSGDETCIWSVGGVPCASTRIQGIATKESLHDMHEM